MNFNRKENVIDVVKFMDRIVEGLNDNPSRDHVKRIETIRLMFNG